MIINIEQLSAIREREKGSKITYTSGAFDLTHRAHVDFLKRAKGKDGILVVGVLSDRRITEIKGQQRPIQNQSDRTAMIDSLKVVDYTVELPYKISGHKFVGHGVVEALRPTNLVTIHENWENSSEWLLKMGTKLRILPRGEGQLSTSYLIERVIVKQLSSQPLYKPDKHL